MFNMSFILQQGVLKLKDARTRTLRPFFGIKATGYETGPGLYFEDMEANPAQKDKICFRKPSAGKFQQKVIDDVTSHPFCTKI